MKSTPILLALATLLLAGCYLQKTKDNVTLPARLDDIVVGKTTIGEAFGILGSPTRSVKLLEHEAFTFEHHVEKRSGFSLIVVTFQRIDRGADAVTLIVDRQGIVQAIGSHFNSREPGFGSPWGE